jgi:hypothetical protein
MGAISIDITNSELLKSLIDIDYNKNTSYDIHNDFDLEAINYSEDKLFTMIFCSTDNSGTILKIIFLDVAFINFDINFKNNNSTIDNFYRGRYEYNGKLYDEYKNKKCFYIEFYEGGFINVLTSAVLIQIDKQTRVVNINHGRNR